MTLWVKTRLRPKAARLLLYLQHPTLMAKPLWRGSRRQTGKQQCRESEPRCDSRARECGQDFHLVCCSNCDGSALAAGVLHGFPILECRFDRQKIFRRAVVLVLLDCSACPRKATTSRRSYCILCENLSQRDRELTIKYRNAGAHICLRLQHRLRFTVPRRSIVEPALSCQRTGTAYHRVRSTRTGDNTDTTGRPLC